MGSFEYSLGSIFKELDMNHSNGLIDNDSVNAGASAFQRYFFMQVKEKLNIDAVYFLRDTDGTPKIPMIYFSAMDTYDSEKIANLHRLAWNMGEAPLLFVVLPDQILVYNNYTPPTPQGQCSNFISEAELFTKIKKISDNEEQRRELLRFHRMQIETGEFWRLNSARFNVNTRVDSTLIRNLRIIRRQLLNSIKKRDPSGKLENRIISEIVHSLLGRSILIKYLEERTDSQGRTVFPENFFHKFLSGAKCYTDVLSCKSATYSLFAELENRFNGDMFPLAECEKDTVSQEDLKELQQFLLGTSDLTDQQLVLWPLYSFNVIPIQLISSIYELFFHLAETDPNKENGTYYTPYHLVSMLMDEVLPWEGSYSPVRILDPACGSGIFLVEAYRRLVTKWIFDNSPNSIKPNNLESILTTCIFGIDCNKEAIRIASFSLSLVMCDFLEPRTIWDELQFPRLVHYNLFHDDFFEDGDFKSKTYDIIIGNPPWESKLSVAAKEYIKRNKSEISDNQIAQAFTWRSGEICPNGVICLLLPSKGFLFNRSAKALTFRKSFFEKFYVSVIINFSAYRWVLFEHAAGPAVAVIYQATEGSYSNPIFYCTPKPLYTIEDYRRFMIEPNNICRIPRDLISDDLIWRVAMWGGPRDMDLVHTIQTAGVSLSNSLDKLNMVYAEGYKCGNKKKEITDFLGLPTLDAKAFSPGQILPDTLPEMKLTRFECTVDTKRNIFKAPHLIIKQSHKGVRFLADVLDFDAVFNHSFLGIHGDSRLLKYYCVLISSKVFSYYQMMTNRKWFVERDESEAGDILHTPFPVPSEEEIEESVLLFNSCIANNNNINYSLIDRFAYRQYKLLDHEIALIESTLMYLYDYYANKGKSISLQKPSNKLLKEYSLTLQQVIQSSLGANFPIACSIYRGNSPLIIAALNLYGSTRNETELFENTTELDHELYRLDELLLEERSESVFVKRNVRIYEQDRIFIVKPNETRYWTYSSACRDADEIFADVMRAWRVENE